MPGGEMFCSPSSATFINGNIGKACLAVSNLVCKSSTDKNKHQYEYQEVYVIFIDDTTLKATT